jgi:hypothetical protein
VRKRIAVCFVVVFASVFGAAACYRREESKRKEEAQCPATLYLART